MSKHNNNKSATATEYTEVERAKLAEFRKRVQNYYPKQDAQLIIWLRARGLNITKAEQMLRRHLIWRKNNQLDSLVEWRSEKVYAPYLFLGNDFEGSPVLLFPFGRYELRGVVESGEFFPALRYLFQAVENMVALAHSQGVSNGTLIMDCEGLRYNQFTNRFLIQGCLEMGRIVEANYPEMLKHGFVINAPRLFGPVFNIVKPVLASQTISKVQVYASDRSKWLSALQKYMPKDIIPPYWGGTRAGSDEFCSEAWTHEPLPRYYMRRLDCVYDDYGQEWISLKIAAGECLTFEYNVTEQQLQYDPVLTWAYYTDGYDLAFGFTLDGADLIEHKRVNSHKGKQRGSHTIDKPGKYVIKFDNTYSRTRSKMLHYVISLTAGHEAEIIVSTPSGSTRALNGIGTSMGGSNAGSVNGNGMATLGLPVPQRNYLNGSQSSIASSCCSCGGSSTNLNGNLDENEREFMDAVDDHELDMGSLKIDSLLEPKSKKGIKSFL